MPYGLEAMTGILAPIVVAGVAVKMTESLFDRNRRLGRGTTSRRRSRARRGSPTKIGNFSNLGIRY